MKQREEFEHRAHKKLPRARTVSVATSAVLALGLVACSNARVGAGSSVASSRAASASAVVTASASASAARDAALADAREFGKNGLLTGWMDSNQEVTSLGALQAGANKDTLTHAIELCERHDPTALHPSPVASAPTPPAAPETPDAAVKRIESMKYSPSKNVPFPLPDAAQPVRTLCNDATTEALFVAYGSAIADTDAPGATRAFYLALAVKGDATLSPSASKAAQDAFDAAKKSKLVLTRIGAISITGGLKEADVRSAVTAHMGEMNRCSADTFRGDPSIAGTMTITFRVGGGRVSDMAVTDGSVFHADSQALRCFAAAVARIQFPDAAPSMLTIPVAVTAQ